jgi:peptide deformylase
VLASGAEVAREGCLSIPDLTANVRRATRIVVEAGDRVIESEGFEARCLLHELDHLDGLLFLDRVDSLKTDVFRRKRYA